MDPDSNRSPSRTARAGERTLHVTVSDGRGRPVRTGGLDRWLATVAPSTARGDVAVALVTDARVRDLNRRYRRKDAPTDVLSFPADSDRPPRRSHLEPEDPHLGDIVIATGVARRQAREAGHPYETELRVLALHGLLHLLGYDHEDEADAGRMARLEARLRRKGGLGSGLIERAGHQPSTSASRSSGSSRKPTASRPTSRSR